MTSKPVTNIRWFGIIPGLVLLPSLVSFGLLWWLPSSLAATFVFLSPSLETTEVSVNVRWWVLSAMHRTPVLSHMMTSSNGNIFRVTDHLCGEFTGHRWFPTQRPVTRSFDVFFGVRLNKRLGKQSWSWWFETPSRSLWRHSNNKKIRNYIILKLNSVYQECCVRGTPLLISNKKWHWTGLTTALYSKRDKFCWVSFRTNCKQMATNQKISLMT